LERCSADKLFYLIAMLKDRDAIVRLLTDDDPATIDLTKRELVAFGPPIVADLRELLDSDLVGAHIQDIIAEIETTDAEKKLVVLCSNFMSPGALEEGCWLLAQFFLPGLDVPAYARQCDRWAAELRDRTVHTPSDLARVQIFGDFFAKELGFKGNSENYFDVKNALLPFVIDTRRGIPSSLALVYMFVAGRAGWTIEGVSLPGHFIVRHGNVLFDPFHGAQILSVRDCQNVFRRQNLPIQPDNLGPVKPKLILSQILANLAYILEGEEEFAQSAKLSSWISLLNNP
jgi:regulator of sirC expression with transglutaminase-like and TPR domain